MFSRVLLQCCFSVALIGALSLPCAAQFVGKKPATSGTTTTPTNPNPTKPNPNPNPIIIPVPYNPYNQYNQYNQYNPYGYNPTPIIQPYPYPVMPTTKFVGKDYTGFIMNNVSQYFTNKMITDSMVAAAVSPGLYGMPNMNNNPYMMNNSMMNPYAMNNPMMNPFIMNNPMMNNPFMNPMMMNPMNPMMPMFNNQMPGYNPFANQGIFGPNMMMPGAQPGMFQGPGFFPLNF